MLLSQLCFVILGFLSGSILFSYHLPLWFKRVDVVRTSADHNPGTANAHPPERTIPFPPHQPLV